MRMGLAGLRHPARAVGSGVYSVLPAWIVLVAGSGNGKELATPIGPEVKPTLTVGRLVDSWSTRQSELIPLSRSPKSSILRSGVEELLFVTLRAG